MIISSDRAEIVADIERELVAEIVRLCPELGDDIVPECHLSNLGFDSRLILELTAVLNRRLGIELSPTEFFEHPTLGELAGHLVDAHLHAGRREAGAPRGTAAVTPNRRGIAIVGMSGRFPGAADVDALWDNLVAGHDPIGDVPPQRWDWRAAAAALEPEQAERSRWGGFIDGVDEFDPLFFGISPKEAQAMDPQQRLLLEHAWLALEDAGCAPSTLAGSDTGVFVAAGVSDYAAVVAGSGAAIESYTSIGLMPSAGANRISYFLDLRGPSETLETACSSSLIAIHRAMSAIAAGDCELAIAGGVNTMLAPQNHLSLAKAGALGPGGRCRAFSDRADGYVRSEGVALLVLKDLAAAERDGDTIHALLIGGAVNHGGRATSLTAPNPRAQAELIVKAHTRADVDPATVTYVEAHGTGTVLGDPIEVAGLKAAFDELYRRRGTPAATGRCGIGSVKSHIGHLELAAGAAGLIRILLQMRHRTLVGGLHIDALNPLLRLEDSPFFVVDRNRPWDAPTDATGAAQPRRAGISSFSVTGSNAHLVVEEYVPASSSAPTIDGPLAIPLSARTPRCLREQVLRLRDTLLRRSVAPGQFASLAQTLRQGRDAMSERIGFIATSPDELIRELDAYLAAPVAPASTWIDRYRPADVMVEPAAVAERCRRQLVAWVSGEAVRWDDGASPLSSRRLRLPGYPFARQRCWIATNAPGDCAGVTRIDATTSTFDIRLRGDETFLADHVVSGQPVLPAVVYLGLVHAAIDAIAARRAGGTAGTIAFTDVAWLTPVVAGAGPIELGLRVDALERDRWSWRIEGCSADGAPTVHARGTVALEPAGPLVRRDLDDTRVRSSRTRYSAVDCYAAFADAGIHYGPEHRAIDGVALGTDEAIVDLRSLGAARPLGDPALPIHPALADGATQGIIGFVLDAMRAEGAPARLAIPFEVTRVRCFENGDRARHALIRRRGVDDVHATYDIDLVAADGSVLVEIQGYALRAVGIGHDAAPRLAAGESTLLSTWQPAISAPMVAGKASERRVLVFGGTADDHLELRRAGAEVDLVDPTAAVEPALREALRTRATVAHLVWILPRSRQGFAPVDEMIAAQEQGVMTGFRLAKALLDEGYGPRELRWTVVTFGAAAVAGDADIDPTHSGVHGLVGAMINEQSAWRARILDFPRDRGLVAEAVLAAPPRARLEQLAFRFDEWWRPQLLPVDAAPVPQYDFEPGSVCIVVGGAGGIGQAWTEAVLRRSPVQFVWIGRRPHDAAIQAKLDHAARFGPAPRYLCADATRLTQLSAARERVLRDYGRIDAVVHATMVLEDRTLANLDEEGFRRAYDAKAVTALRVAQVFRSDTLRHLLFFSAYGALARNAGQSNYVAGCAFADALAHTLAMTDATRVRVVNWGYWGDVGGAATDYYRERMTRLGIGSVTMAGAMQALDRLLGGDCVQMAHVGLLRPARVDGLVIVPVAAIGKTTGPVESPRVSVIDCSREDALAALLAALHEHCSDVLGIDFDDSASPFADALLGEYGMDSLTSTTLRSRLQKHLGADVRVHALISETPRRIAETLYEQLLLQHLSAEREDAGAEREVFML